MGPSYCHAAVGSSEIEEEREMHGACPLGSHCVQAGESGNMGKVNMCNLSPVANGDMKPAWTGRETAVKLGMNNRVMAFNTCTMCWSNHWFEKVLKSAFRMTPRTVTD